MIMCCLQFLLRCVNSILFYFLFQHGASVNLFNTKGNTALHEAVIGRHKALVELLLQNGALTHIRNKRQCTPVDCAEPVSTKVCLFLPIGFLRRK